MGFITQLMVVQYTSSRLSLLAGKITCSLGSSMIGLHKNNVDGASRKRRPASAVTANSEVAASRWWRIRLLQLSSRCAMKPW